VEFEANLQYSTLTFTTAVQDKFKVSVAAACNAGSVCHVSKETVNIMSIVQNSVPRRRLHATSISVGVMVFVKNQADGNRIIGVLSKDNLNQESQLAGLEPMAFSVSAPVTIVNTLAKSTSPGFGLSSILIPVVLVGVLVEIAMIRGGMYYV